ncbi:MAG: hypothetical protein AUK43_09230 [Oscillatoriales cyanobacterium CG2_30_40_61]|nr:MAG: hypothetical protein AUK43_09230 [Oscillatoriales cyanobacterium CG2_30_40_61]
MFFGHWVEGITSFAKLDDLATKFNSFGDNLYSSLQIEEDGSQLNDRPLTIAILRFVNKLETYG